MRTRTVLLASVAYIVVGMETAALAGMATSPTGVKAWRLVAWLLSLVVFGIHFKVARSRGMRRSSVAAPVALAVAIGALGVAALGPVRGHWGEPHLFKLVLLSLIAWPVLAGVPAFVAALAIDAALMARASASP